MTRLMLDTDFDLHLSKKYINWVHFCVYFSFIIEIVFEKRWMKEKELLIFWDRISLERKWRENRVIYKVQMGEMEGEKGIKLSIIP